MVFCYLDYVIGNGRLVPSHDDIRLGSQRNHTLSPSHTVPCKANVITLVAPLLIFTELAVCGPVPPKLEFRTRHYSRDRTHYTLHTTPYMEM